MRIYSECMRYLVTGRGWVVLRTWLRKGGPHAIRINC